MKNILYACFFFSFSLLQSQEVIYKKDYLGRTVAQDEYGNVIAVGEKNYLGNFVWKDKYGNIIKEETIDYLGRLVSKDKNGNVISRGKTNYLGQFEEKDEYGNTIAVYERNYLGQIEKKDKYGNVTGKYDRTYDGKIKYEVEPSSSSNGAYRNPKVYSSDPNAFNRGFQESFNKYASYANSYNNSGTSSYYGPKNRNGYRGFAIGLGFVPQAEGGLSGNAEVFLNTVSIGFKYNLMNSIEYYHIAEEYIGTLGLKIIKGLYFKGGLGVAIYNPRTVYASDSDLYGVDETFPNETTLLLGINYFFRGNGGVGWSPELFYSNQTGVGVGANIIF